MWILMEGDRREDEVEDTGGATESLGGLIG